MQSLLRLIFAILAFSLVSSAAVIRRETNASGECCFSVNAVGSLAGPVVQDAIGENRIGGVFPQGGYCLKDGILTDGLGHTCLIWSSSGQSSQQFQCTSGVPASKPFTLTDSGYLLYDGCPKFFACPASGPTGNGSYNIYSDKLSNTTDCLNIQLLAGGFDCAAKGSSTTTITEVSSTWAPVEFPTSQAIAWPESSLIPSQTTSTDPTSSSVTYQTGLCTTDLTPDRYVAPNLIVPVSPTSPEISYGSQYTANISPDNATAFAFDIPVSWSDSDNLCALVFKFPFGNRATFPYQFSGLAAEIGASGGLDFALLGSADNNINNATSYGTLPAVAMDYGKTQIEPGENYTISQFPCQAGYRSSYLASSVGNVGLKYFQSSADSPLGLFVVHCN
jgi:hypothetical protein